MKHIITKEDLKEHLKNHKTLITYTRDINGFKNGVVVAVGKGQTGYSKVNPEDSAGSISSTNALPYWNRFKTLFLASDQDPFLHSRFSEVVKSIASFDTWLTDKPKFDRFTALKLAINMAISNAKQDNIPYSIIDSLDEMYVRSMIYFK